MTRLSIISAAFVTTRTAPDTGPGSRTVNRVVSCLTRGRTVRAASARTVTHAFVNAR